MDNKPIKLIGIGLITGIVNGLFGSGGGTLVVPALVFLLGVEDYKAHATAISIILPLSIISTFIYLRNSIIRFDIALIVVLGGILGSFFGAKILKKVPATILRKIFGSVIIITAYKDDNKMKLFIIGFLSGIISGMGIGGGTILIPSLVLFSSLKQQEAQGINLIVFIPVAIVALAVHFKEKNIDFKYAKWIIIGGVGGSIIGSLFAVRINPDSLRKYFGFFLLFIGIYELFKKNRS